MSEAHKRQIISPIVAAIAERQKRINEQLATSVVNQVSAVAQRIGDLVANAPLDEDSVTIRNVDVSILSILANVGIDITIDSETGTGRVALPTTGTTTVATPQQPKRPQIAPGAPQKRQLTQVDGEVSAPPESAVRRLDLDMSPSAATAQQRLAVAARRVAENPADSAALEELSLATAAMGSAEKK